MRELCVWWALRSCMYALFLHHSIREIKFIGSGMTVVRQLSLVREIDGVSQKGRFTGKGME